MLTERPSVGLVRARVLQPLGADPNIAEVRGIVSAPEDEAAVIEALLEQLDRRAGEWDWLVLGGIRQASDAYSIVGRRSGVEWGAGRV